MFSPLLLAALLLWTTGGGQADTVYYVTPTTGDQGCPTGQECHLLSYYTSDNIAFPTGSNVTLLFLPGEHRLTNTSLQIQGVYKLILTAATQDDVVVVRCTGGSDGMIRLSAVQSVYINGLMIDSCGNGFIVTGVSHLSITNVSIRHCYQSGLTVTDTSYILIERSLFSNNLNAALSLSFPLSNSAVTLQNMAVVSNVNPITLYCHEFTTITLINVTVANNIGSGVYAEGSCRLTFANKTSTIANNSSPGNGGGLWIGDRGAVGSDQYNTKVYFIHNAANRTGGAIYFQSSTVRIGKKNCSIFNFHGVFMHNYGIIAGDDIYGGTYFNCYNPQDGELVTDTDSSFISRSNCSSNRLFQSFPKPLSTHVTSNPLGVCLCQDTGIVDCGIRSIDVHLSPGRWITLSLVTVGVCGGVSPGTLLMERSNSIRVFPADGDMETDGKHCKNFAFEFRAYNSEDSIIRIGLRTSNDVGKDLQGSALTLNISPLNCLHGYDPVFGTCERFVMCPLGLQLVDGSCQCNDVIESISGTQCNVSRMPYPISRSGNNWLYYSQQYNCTVAYENCPFDYCNTSTVSLSLNESDLQCTQDRSGILCGQCQPGLSLMLGSNRCASCDNKYLSLMILFVLAGPALILFLLVCNLTVSIGTINGLLFYTNMIKILDLNRSLYHQDIPVLTQFIAWLNLDFGIETCFIDGLDGYSKTWLQFVFPIYICTLALLFVILCRCSNKLQRLSANRALPVLATVILMSYTKLLRIVGAALMKSTLVCEEIQWSVWSVDGNISFMSGKHTPLVMVSVLLLLVALTYTGYLLVYQLILYLSNRNKAFRFLVRLTKPFTDAYSAPYREKFQFWTGLLLFVRLLVVFIAANTTEYPQLKLYVTMLQLMTLLHVSKGIYKSWLVGLLEYVFLKILGIKLVLVTLLNYLEWDFDLSQLKFRLILAVTLIIDAASLIALVVIHVLLHTTRSRHNMAALLSRTINQRRSQVVINDEGDDPLLGEDNREEIEQDEDASPRKKELYSPSHIIGEEDL